jgi:hypothetical protein
MDVSTLVSVSCGSVETTVLYCVEIIVPPGSLVVMLRIWVMVEAGRIDNSVRTSVEAGWMDVSVIERRVVAVPVACGRVEMIKRVLAGWVETIVWYCVEMIISPWIDVANVRICVSVLAGKNEVSVWKRVDLGSVDVM